MVEDFGVPPTTVSTAIVMYWLVAALVTVGATVGHRIGWVPIFGIVVLAFAVAEVMMVAAPSVE
jgi:hypothetical protein